MKKINKVFNTAVAIGSAVVLAFVATSCDMLQSMLSSEQEQELTSETGTASLSGSTWYYNGSSESNMTGTTDNTLCISFGKKVALSTSGLSGSFTITYTDANSNSTTVTKDLNGGSFSSDYTSYYLNLSPVISLLDTTTIPAGTMAVQVKVSGFVCDEGSQKGRSIDTFKKNISVEPLYASSTLKGITFNTLYATSGNAVKIPLNGVTTLASDASIEVTAKTGSSLPDGLTSSNFTLSVSTDGLSLLVTPNVEMNQQNFSAYLTIGGLVPALNGAEKTQSFLVNFVGAIMSDDTTLTTYASDTNVNKAISSMTLSNDASNLYVSLSFNATPTAWENDHIVIMIDDTNLESGVSTIASSTTGAPATYTTVGSTVEFFGYEIMKSGSPVNMTSDTTWTQNASDWKYYGSNTTVKYTIPFSSIGTTVASSSDTLHVVAFFSAGWSSTDSHISNAVPASALTVSTTSGTADTVAVDFSKGLSMTIGSTGETVTYTAPAAPAGLYVSKVTGTTATLTWTKSYGATTYTVARSNSADGTFTDIKSGIAATTYQDTGLTVGTTYYYKICAVNTKTGAYTSAVTATTASAVVTPGSFTVSGTPSATSVVLTWTKASNADSYDVAYGTSSGTYDTNAATSITSCTATISNLTSETSYYIQVTAKNASDSTSSTAIATVTTTSNSIDITDGVLDTAYTASGSASSTTSWSDASTDISAMYVTNDATYLYVALKFASAPVLSNGDVITLLFDNASVTSGTAATTSSTWNDGMATSLSLMSDSSVELQVSTEYTSWNSKTTTTGGTCGATWSSGTANSTIIEYKIPLADIGTLVTPGKVYVFAAVSKYKYYNRDGRYVLDCIPSSSAIATTSTAGTTAGITNDCIYLSMPAALSYTIK